MRRPRPVASYPSANMLAAKMRHTASLENPERAHLVASAGVFPTNSSAAATVTPIKPMAAAGEALTGATGFGGATVGEDMGLPPLARRTISSCYQYCVKRRTAGGGDLQLMRTLAHRLLIPVM